MFNLSHFLKLKKIAFVKPFTEGLWLSNAKANLALCGHRAKVWSILLNKFHRKLHFHRPQMLDDGWGHHGDNIFDQYDIQPTSDVFLLLWQWKPPTAGCVCLPMPQEQLKQWWIWDKAPLNLSPSLTKERWWHQKHVDTIRGGKQGQGLGQQSSKGRRNVHQKNNNNNNKKKMSGGKWWVVA